ncbi:class I SAM-dependent methyltransferase [Nocardioides sp.]|uniref:class I SAM-dependent methyltransferase n=1 Tax=Nocardioides sp. TaxID=35761 RepID=UPI00261AF244|nr:class I SAM-dependent methyltransferase [Nocardioides sp.]MCW2739181.1 class SAM-dependent methyltransferase [Nocardioides sp.]
MDDITSTGPLRTQHATADGHDPAAREAFKAIDRAMVGDSDVLEVGCGAGAMAERINALPGVRLVAVDWSESSVTQTAARGVDARRADVCYLPFEDDTFDVVHAGWMLHHVRDLDRALAEVRRVLRPGGTFVALTDGETRHFSSENGEFTLTRRFSDVRRQDLEMPDGDDVTVFEAR